MWNAFNSVTWHNIMLSLDNLKVPFYLRRTVSSYLTDCTLLYDNDNYGTHNNNITGGVPQSSVVGCLIWNVLYDRLLMQLLQCGMSMVAYADDVAPVVIEAINEVQHQADAAIKLISERLRNSGLSLAAKKTEALHITRTENRKYATFTVKDRNITTDTLNKERPNIYVINRHYC